MHPSSYCSIGVPDLCPMVEFENLHMSQSTAVRASHRTAMLGSSMHTQHSISNSVRVSAHDMDFKLGQSLVGHSFGLCFIFVPAFLLDRIILGQKIWRWVGVPISPLGAVSNYWRWFLQVTFPHCWALWQRSSPLCPGSLPHPRTLGLSRGDP